MAGYDDAANALTLGDDEVLRIGDYEIRYNSTTGDWEAVYTPTGDVANVPTNQSGSLFPTDFADALAGQVLADDGNLYGSVQNAENAASDWMFVGPGTFSESVTLNTPSLTVLGAGHDTLIDGGTTGHGLIINDSDIVVRNLSVRTTGGGGTSYDAIADGTAGHRPVIDNVYIRDSDRYGIYFDSTEDALVRRVWVLTADGTAMRFERIRNIVMGCFVADAGTAGIQPASGAHDTVIVGNSVYNAADDGIQGRDDGIVAGNRVRNAGDDGIAVFGNDCIVANNRISGSYDLDIYDTGTNTTLDGNVTGAAN